MGRMSITTGPWKDMLGAYQKMGLSEEEVSSRIICKTSKVISRQFHLDECDNGQTSGVE